MSARRDLLAALTPLRFPAAAVVFVAHAWGVLKARGGAEWAPWVVHASIGVSFFFVLSGFILTYNYLDELREPTRRSVWNFFVARWARTYPVHLLTLLFLLPVMYSTFASGAFGNPRTMVVTHVLLGHGFLPEISAKANSLNPPSWSLSAEWFLYLSLPLLIPGLTTGSWARRAAVLLLALAPWAVAVADVAGALALPAWFSPYRYPPVRLVDFVAGVLLGLLWRSRHGVTTPVTTSVRRATVAEVAALLFLAAWVWVVARETTNMEWAKTARWIGVYLPPCLLLIWVLARGGGLVSRALKSGPVAYLGEISFAFYMIHWSVLITFATYGPRFGTRQWGFGWRWAACAGIAFVLAVACYHLYEIPLRDRLRRALSIRRPAPVPDAPAVPEAPAVLPLPTSAPDKRAA